MLDSLAHFAWVALGATIGGPARFFVSGVLGRSIGETFPWGTLAVNASGSLAIGCIAAVADRSGIGSDSAAWLFVVTGVLGSFTTVSSFSLQTLSLLRDGDFRRASLNIALSFSLCLGFAAAGYFVAIHA